MTRIFSPSEESCERPQLKQIGETVTPGRGALELDRLVMAMVSPRRERAGMLMGLLEWSAGRWQGQALRWR